MIPVAHCGAFDYCLEAVLGFLVPRQDHLNGRKGRGLTAEFYQIILSVAKTKTGRQE